jgi:hypothetical protein
MILFVPPAPAVVLAPTVVVTVWSLTPALRIASVTAASNAARRCPGDCGNIEEEHGDERLVV